MPTCSRASEDRVHRDHELPGYRFRLRYTTAAARVKELVEAAGDRQLGRTNALSGRVDLLETDELGNRELDRRGAGEDVACMRRPSGRRMIVRPERANPT
ncbi:hypothetical protein AB0N36_08695 [Streptomyces acidicola]